MSDYKSESNCVPVVDTRPITGVQKTGPETHPESPVWSTQMVDLDDLKPISRPVRTKRGKQPASTSRRPQALRGPVIAACFILLSSAGGFVLYQSDVRAEEPKTAKTEEPLCFGVSCEEPTAKRQVRKTRIKPAQLKPEQKTLVAQPKAPVHLALDQHVAEIIRADNGKSTQMQCTEASEVLATGRAKLVMVVASYCKNCKRLLRRLGTSPSASDVETVVFSDDYFSSETHYRSFEKRTIQVQRKVLWALGDHPSRVYLGGFDQHGLIKQLFGDPPAIPVIMVVDRSNRVVTAWQTSDVTFVDKAADAVRQLNASVDSDKDKSMRSERRSRPDVRMACEKPVELRPVAGSGNPPVRKVRRGQTRRRVTTPVTTTRPSVNKPPTKPKPAKKPVKTKQPADIKPPVKPPAPAEVDKLDW